VTFNMLVKIMIDFDLMRVGVPCNRHEGIDFVRKNFPWVSIN
jgi:hypothetical protein